MTFRSVLALSFSFIGLKRIRGRDTPSQAKKSFAGSVFGIALSLIPLLIVAFVTDGMIEGISSRMIELGSYHVQLIDFGFYGSSSDYVNIASELLSVSEVAAAYPERQGECIVVGGESRSGGMLRAVDPAFFSRDEAVKRLFEVKAGALSLDDPRGALIGEKLAQTIGVGAGDVIRVITMKKNESGRSVPRVSSFTVTGIISSGYQELDALWVYVPFESGFSLLSPDSSRTLIGVKTDAPSENIDELKKELRVLAPAGFSPYSWYELNRGQYKSLETTRTLLVFIMVLILLVACVNISAALVMLVMERRREIAILKSVGASPAGITLAFVIAGVATGLGGVCLGLPIGAACAIHINGIISAIERIVNLAGLFWAKLADPAASSVSIKLLDPAYYLETIPITIDFKRLFFPALGTLLLSALVSLSPSIRAGKEKPLALLRKF